MSTTVTVVVLAWGDEPLLEESVRSALSSEGVAVDVVVVDNGAGAAQIAAVAALPGVQVLVPPANLGFAGGCNLGAEHASGEVLMFLNSDARVAPDAARMLSAALSGDVGLVMASVRLWQDPGLMNSSGNPWHYLGFVWAGGLDEPVAEHSLDSDVLCASGATMAIRRSDWTGLGGFDDAYFAYHEDAELSLRVWQRGQRVRYIAGAASYHHYEFSRNPAKQYLLERNRLMSLLTHYQLRTLLLLAPPLLAAEAGVLLLAAKQGWLRKKLAGYAWLARNRAHIARRRRDVQGQRTVSDRDLAPRFASTIDAAMLGPMPGLSLVNGVLRGYWRLIRVLLPRRASRRSVPGIR